MSNFVKIIPLWRLTNSLTAAEGKTVRIRQFGPNAIPILHAGVPAETREGKRLTLALPAVDWHPESSVEDVFLTLSYELEIAP